MESPPVCYRGHSGVVVTVLLLLSFPKLPFVLVGSLLLKLRTGLLPSELCVYVLRDNKWSEHTGYQAQLYSGISMCWNGYGICKQPSTAAAKISLFVIPGGVFSLAFLEMSSVLCEMGGRSVTSRLQWSLSV